VRLVVEWLGGRTWRLAWPLTWRSMTVPAGFITDLASTPRWVGPLLPPIGAYAPAAVIHDWLYATPTGGSRRDADRAFLAAMREAGVPRWQRWLLYVGVRIGGVGRGHWR